ncbi:MAG: helix-turn-helix domain-containing protein [Peptococcaceae bacterium]
MAWFNDFSGLIRDFKPIVSFRGKNLLEMDFIISKMLEEFKKKETGYLSVLFGYLNVLFAKLFRQIYFEKKVDIRQDIPRITDGILEYIKKNYNKKISVEELAKKSFYSSTYFSSLFKECYGISPIQYINNTRIEKAMELLETEVMSVEQVMKYVGYSDRKHFYKLFKESTGFAPGEYKKRIKGTVNI